MAKKLSSYLKKKLFMALPTKHRHALIRKAIDIPQKEDSKYIFKLAETESEFSQAYELLHDSYVEQGFIQPQKSKMRILPHFVLPTSVTLIAKTHEGVVVGTLSIIKKSALQLPMEKEFSLFPIKKNQDPYAEISALAVKKGHRRVSGGNIFFFMLNFMYHYCVTQLSIRYLCIVIHPKDEDFYSALLFFRRLPEAGIIDYMGAPALAMYLDLATAIDNFAEVYGNQSDKKNLLRFFMKKFSNLHYIERPYYLNSFSTVTPQIFYDFFIKKGFFFDVISFSEFKILKKALASTDLSQYLVDDSLDDLSKRKELRVSSGMTGKLIANGTVALFKVTDVSANGLQLHVDKENLKELIGKNSNLFLNLGEGVNSKIVGKILWEAHPYYGFKISLYDSNWKEFINYLYKGQKNYILKAI